MAFGIMNTRRYTLVFLFLFTFMINCLATQWTMWVVPTFCFFMLMLTDFMFFGVRRSPAPQNFAPPQIAYPARTEHRRAALRSFRRADSEFW